MSTRENLLNTPLFYYRKARRAYIMELQMHIFLRRNVSKTKRYELNLMKSKERIAYLREEMNTQLQRWEQLQKQPELHHLYRWPSVQNINQFKKPKHDDIRNIKQGSFDFFSKRKNLYPQRKQKR